MRRLLRRPGLALGLIFVLVPWLAACQTQALPYVRLSQAGQPLPTLQPGQASRLPLRLAIAAVISPRATLDTYGPLLDYLSSRLERPVDLIQRSTYAEINELIRRGGADVAFVCGGAFVEGEREFGMQLLVVPQVGGQTTYYSYIIVAGDSPIQSLADLRGHSFAFTDPLSNSGHLSPLWLLNQMGESPETFFSQTTFTYSHDNSIRAVAEHVVDAAAVDSLVYDYVVARDPTYLERVRIIHRSAPYGIPPVVVHPQIDPALRAELLQVFLDMDDNDEGRAVLQDLRIERFIEGDPAMYESIRQMAITLRNWYVSP
jgi:phosphonate transport system substrate-binding protein